MTYFNNKMYYTNYKHKYNKFYSIILYFRNLESEGMQRLKEKRLLIKAIRLAERTSNFNKKKAEEEESDEY